jgi:hypothetical protein
MQLFECEACGQPLYFENVFGGKADIGLSLFNNVMAKIRLDMARALRRNQCGDV